MELLESLYGSTIKKENCVGYCRYHKCYMTVNQLKQKECLRKQCSLLNKRESHEYWAQRELLKIAKKNTRRICNG